ncbi:Uncharacterized protein AXF42_Ash006856 [Apostasia shenzhenica]|uniref:Uncharacterized protein n=1 Tax=Apostasia shenzhenica TaxID=1088818 RepID=A0A2I0AJB3_9ASPA|nr:Uncharacterized protein AXF42_Ash006856 [Apostasia shenzhenica]
MNSNAHQNPLKKPNPLRFSHPFIILHVRKAFIFFLTISSSLIPISLSLSLCFPSGSTEKSCRAPMEKAPTSKGKIMLKYLQKAASFTITSHPHSPRAAGGGGDRRPPRGYSGQIASIFPRESGFRKKSDVGGAGDNEPTSPKVTCIGQIKHKKKAAAAAEQLKKKKMMKKKTAFFEKKGVEKEKEKRPRPPAPTQAPALGRMRRFASGRETLAEFDWKAAAAAMEDPEEEVIIPHSAPILVGGGGAVAPEPKNENFLWRRRAMAKPMPLQLNN